jgi:hypothetical protein
MLVHMDGRTLGAALAGGATIGVVYAIARALGLTDADLARRAAPGRPLVGRLTQLSAGATACLPAARSGSPLRAVAAGLTAGALPALRGRHRPLGARAVDLAAHVAGALSAHAAGRR